MPPELGDKMKQQHGAMGISEADLKGESEHDKAEIERTLKTLQGENK